MGWDRDSGWYERPQALDPASPTADEPMVTLLVAAHNEAGNIEACVRSLIASDYRKREIIVVDDASTDGTTAILRSLVERLPFRLLVMPTNVGKKRALVEGIRCARGEIFIFTDSDCLVASTAVTCLAAAFVAHPDLGAASGHARALNAEHGVLTRMQDVWYDGQFGVQKAAESVFGSVTCVSGPLAAFRREAVINYFPAWAADRFAGREFRFATDRQLTGYVLGQQWLGASLKARHASDPLVTTVDYPPRRWRIEYVASARAWTIVPSTVRSFVRQQTSLEEELHPEPLLHRHIPLASWPCARPALLPSHRLRGGCADPRISPSRLDASSRHHLADRPLHLRSVPKGLRVGGRIQDPESPKQSVAIPAVDEPHVYLCVVLVAHLQRGHIASEHPMGAQLMI